MAQANYWFPRRRFGRGWALHRSWQGWLLIVATLALAALGRTLIASGELYSAYLLVLLAGVIGLCCWKGERSVWRGPRNRPPRAE
ncbi:MAG TPA: hypothetical protein VK178_09530 [Opitutaceae bacterium]|nr:hypothetical protein [Opitutaceae bacterium]